jgi:ABC-2 type transport system permease protein
VNEALGTLPLVAAREVRERLRSNGFWVSTWLSLAAVIVAVVLPSLHRSEQRPARIGVVGTIDATTRSQLAKLVGESNDRSVVDLVGIDDARLSLRAHAVDVVVVDGTRVMTRNTIDVSAGDATTALAVATGRVLATQAQLGAAGLSAAQINKVLDTADPVTYESVDGRLGGADRGSRRATAAIGVAMIVLLLTIYGNWMLNGVLEEKSSRVIELMIAAVSPSRLLRGKILGIGIVALIQGTVIAAAALGASAIASASSPVRGEHRLLVAIVGWFVLGYVLYGAAFALVGALSRRHDEAQGLSLLVLAPLLATAAAMVPTLTGRPVDALTRVLSLVPLTAPVAMPVRQAAGPVPAAQLTLAVAGLVVGAAVLVAISGRAYRRSTLRRTRRRPRAPTGAATPTVIVTPTVIETLPPPAEVGHRPGGITDE